LRANRLDDTELAFARATESVEGFERLGWPVELGRSLLVRAQIAHRSRHYRMATSDATAAALCFGKAGHGSWAKVAADAVERYARRRRLGDDRTATQEQIAVLVRQGLSNSELAARMHVSVKTIESHLTDIYRRSRVSSRGAFQALQQEATVEPGEVVSDEEPTLFTSP
jgi:DNA-binding CsgD family transcriptional regulator